MNDIRQYIKKTTQITDHQTNTLTRIILILDIDISCSSSMGFCSAHKTSKTGVSSSNNVLVPLKILSKLNWYSSSKLSGMFVISQSVALRQYCK
jgi:hypothetical protein